MLISSSRVQAEETEAPKLRIWTEVTIVQHRVTIVQYRVVCLHPVSSIRIVKHQHFAQRVLETADEIFLESRRRLPQLLWAVEQDERNVVIHRIQMQQRCKQRGWMLSLLKRLDRCNRHILQLKRRHDDCSRLLSVCKRWTLLADVTAQNLRVTVQVLDGSVENLSSSPFKVEVSEVAVECHCVRRVSTRF